MRTNQKKKSMWFGIMLILCVMVIVAVLVATAVSDRVKTQETSAPDKIFTNYITALQKKDYEKMYNLLSDSSKKEMTKDEFINRNQKIYNGIEMKNLKVDNVEWSDPSNGGIVVSYEMSMNTVVGRISFKNSAKYISDPRNGYALSWKDSMILPNLGPSDKVQVSTSKAERGEILDRNGEKLACKEEAASVGIIPGKLKSKESSIKKIAELLEMTEDQVNSKINAKWVKNETLVPIKTIKKVDELALSSQSSEDDNVKNKEVQDELKKIEGVEITSVDQRSYPLGEAAAHLIGYIKNITADELKKHAGEGYTSDSVIGKSGVESLYEDELRGQDGEVIRIVTRDGKQKEVVASKEKKDGKTITLTIDANLQKKLYEEYKEDKSVSVAMNPYSGEVLALVSTPSYDSNDFITGMSEKKWNALNNDENKPMFNRFRQAICPGSTFKPIISAIGLECGAIDPNKNYKEQGLSWQKDSTWGSYSVTTLHRYSPVTMENALIYSDNIYFAKAALEIGKNKLQDNLDKLGFTSKFPFDIIMTKSQYSNTGSIEGEIQLADSGYGQGQMLINPLHLATLYTAFTNEGSMIKPYLKYEKDKKPDYFLKNVFSKENTELVKEALVKVVNDPRGTGITGKRTDVTLAGKTGTAEIKDSKTDTNGTELGWFASFTADKNVSKPILMVTMVEDVKGRGGSTYVVRKNGNVLDEYFK